jgi:hypothetical protein
MAWSKQSIQYLDQDYSFELTVMMISHHHYPKKTKSLGFPTPALMNQASQILMIETLS